MPLDIILITPIVWVSSDLTRVFVLVAFLNRPFFIVWPKIRVHLRLYLSEFSNNLFEELGLVPDAILDRAITYLHADQLVLDLGYLRILFLGYLVVALDDHLACTFELLFYLVKDALPLILVGFNSWLHNENVGKFVLKLKGSQQEPEVSDEWNSLLHGSLLFLFHDVIKCVCHDGNDHIQKGNL